MVVDALPPAEHQRHDVDTSGKIKMVVLKRWPNDKRRAGDVVYLGPITARLWEQSGRAKRAEPERPLQVQAAPQNKAVFPEENKAEPFRPVLSPRTCTVCGKICKTVQGRKMHEKLKHAME